MGHEGCGTVLSIGPGVHYIKEGDLVVLHWREGKGIRSKPPKYKWRGETLNAGWVTTFNSHAVVSENRCTPIPKNTDEVAALFGCAITTGFGVVENNAKIKIGESVVVFGAGGIGLNILQASRMVSAWPIIAVDLHKNKLDLAKKMGATHLINANKKNVKDEIIKILNGKKLDLFIDNTGLLKLLSLAMKLRVQMGRLF